MPFNEDPSLARPLRVVVERHRDGSHAFNVRALAKEVEALSAAIESPGELGDPVVDLADEPLVLRRFRHQLDFVDGNILPPSRGDSSASERLVLPTPSNGKCWLVDGRNREIAVLECIRSGFTTAAASCNKAAKAIVGVTTERIAERRGRRREYAGGNSRGQLAQ
jgi:hypothetical protein